MFKKNIDHDYLNYRIEQMRSERSSYMSHWQELNRNFMPRKGKFSTSDRNKGSKKNQLSNNTPIFAKRTLRSGMMAGVTSPARPWFKLLPPDPDMAGFGPVREWLDYVEKILYRVFDKSGVYRALPHIYEELGVIGQGVMMMEEDFDNIARFTPFTVGEYMLAINGQRRVDTFAREFQLSTYELVSRFGLDNVSTHVRNQYDVGNYSSLFEVRHMIEPVDGREIEGHKPLNKKFKWRSVFYETSECGKNDYLKVEGYHENPILSPRWDVKPGDTYSLSPGMDALGDAFALQTQEREKGKAVSKMVSPPMKAPSKMKETQISLLPGAVNYVNDTTNAFSSLYEVNPRVNELSMDIEKTEARILKAFYADVFRPILDDRRNQRATATEIVETKEEALLELGPVMENVSDELLVPMIDRAFNMIIRLSEPGWRGMSQDMIIPPPPPELEGQDLKIEFVSVLAQAQKMVSTGAMERWIGFGGNMAGIGLGDALDSIDVDAVMKEMAEDLGVPNSVIRGDDEVAGIRDQRAQAQQASMAAEMGASLSQSAKMLGDVDTTGKNAVTDIMAATGAG